MVVDGATQPSVPRSQPKISRLWRLASTKWLETVQYPTVDFVARFRQGHSDPDTWYPSETTQKILWLSYPDAVQKLSGLVSLEMKILKHRIPIKKSLILSDLIRYELNVNFVSAKTLCVIIPPWCRRNCPVSLPLLLLGYSALSGYTLWSSPSFLPSVCIRLMIKYGWASPWKLPAQAKRPESPTLASSDISTIWLVTLNLLSALNWITKIIYWQVLLPSDKALPGFLEKEDLDWIPRLYVLGFHGGIKYRMGGVPRRSLSKVRTYMIYPPKT